MKQTCMVMLAAGAVSLFAAQFSIGIGSPIAANVPAVKNAAMVVRPENCSEPAKVEFSGSAEGLVSGARQSVVLKLTPIGVGGVHAVNRNWPEAGAWVLSLRAVCGGETAGALVPFGPNGFVRESAKFLSHAPSRPEMELAVKTFAGNSQ